MSARTAFVDRAAQQILVFDGGYGTAIQGTNCLKPIIAVTLI